MKTIYKILLLSTLLFMGSCELDLLDDPNNGKIETANVGMLLNSVELQFNSLMNNLSSNTRSYTRMQYQFGDYVSGATQFDRAWRTYYAGILADTQILIKEAEKDELRHYKQVGIAKILEAYATISMVDFFGDIPYSEAVQGDENINPIADLGENIYDKMYLLLDEAIANLENEDAVDIEFVDVFFEDDSQQWDNWKSLAKTLKFKMYVQSRKYNEDLSAAGITALLNDGDLLDNVGENFEFKYGTSVSAPDTRHPLYSGNYSFSGVGGYMSNTFMNELKENNDPRLRYYFFRQTVTDPSGADLVCNLDDPDPNILCYIGDSYWGRDHATTAGLPPDTDKRTTWGLYPAGGKFDANNASSVEPGNGAGGAGINPILLMSYVSFLKAEAALTLTGVDYDARSFFETAMRQSIDHVVAFGNLEGANVPDAYTPDTGAIDTFVNARLAEYDAAAGEDAKLKVIMKQYWVALWGNGVESYNNYRRTGLPALQHPLSSGTVFPRVNLYPSSYVNFNSNAEIQPLTNQVFWDTNAAGFID